MRLSENVSIGKDALGSNRENNLKLLHFSLAALAGIGLALPAAAAPKRYRLVELPLPGVSTNAVARAISANGSITGEAFESGTSTGLTAVSYGNAAALAASYSAVPAGTTNSFTRGVNDFGVAAGAAQNANDDLTSAILTGPGGLTVLTPLSGLANAGAAGINNAGLVVGYSMSVGIFFAEGTARPISNGSGSMQATVWIGGAASGLNNPFGSFNSIATSINAAGQIAGVVNDSLNQGKAVIWNNGIATTLDTLGNQISTARSINSNGGVAGQTITLGQANGRSGTVWTADGTRFGLSALAGCANSDARGINASNNVVGFSQVGAGCSAPDQIATGTFWNWNGAGYDTFAINDLVVNLNGWDLIAPQSINDRGQIVGFGINADGRSQGFLLQAVPEPASWAMLIAGFGLVGAMSRRRRALAGA